MARANYSMCLHTLLCHYIWVLNTEWFEYLRKSVFKRDKPVGFLAVLSNLSKAFFRLLFSFLTCDFIKSRNCPLNNVYINGFAVELNGRRTWMQIKNTATNKCLFDLDNSPQNFSPSVVNADNAIPILGN